MTGNVCGMEDEAEEVALEQKSVHSIYDTIASHFSETRYKVRCNVPTVFDISPGH